MRLSSLPLLILLPLAARPDASLEVRRFTHQASNAVVSCYAEGQPKLTLPWTDLLDLLTPAAREWIRVPPAPSKTPR